MCVQCVCVCVCVWAGGGGVPSFDIVHYSSITDTIIFFQ